MIKEQPLSLTAQCQVEENADVSTHPHTHTEQSEHLKERAIGTREMQQNAFINSITPQFSEASQCPHYHSGLAGTPPPSHIYEGHAVFYRRRNLHPAHMAVLYHPSFLDFIVITKPHGSLGLLLRVFCKRCCSTYLPSLPDPQNSHRPNRHRGVCCRTL